MKVRVLICGSFDPFHIGHVDLIKKTLNFADEIVIGVGVNTTKTPISSAEERVELIRNYFKNEKRIIKVAEYTCSTVQFCKDNKINLISRGLRNAKDFDYESEIARVNKELGSPDTIFLLANPEISWISSSMIKIMINRGEKDKVEKFIITKLNLYQ